MVYQNINAFWMWFNGIELRCEFVALWPYVIVYRVTPVGVEILDIWHGAQSRAE